MKYRAFIIISLLIIGNAAATQESWSTTYKKIIKSSDVHRDYLLFEQKTVPFTQLIMCWNAQRPETGYYEFFIRARDQKTKKWLDWHKMIEWGAHVQKSFFSRSKGSCFNYARFEMDETQRGDMFQVKVVAHDASLRDVKALMVTATDLTTFVTEPYNQRAKDLPSFYIRGVPKKSQLMVDHPRNGAICSPTSMSMVTGALLQEDVDSLDFAEHVYDSGLNIFGNWAFNMAHAFEQCEQNVWFYVARLTSFKELYTLLHNNIPIALSVRGTLRNGKKPYNNGHFLVVVGWDAEHRKVICYDPAFDNLDQVEVAYDINDFIQAWENSRRLVYKPEVIL